MIWFIGFIYSLYIYFMYVFVCAFIYVQIISLSFLFNHALSTCPYFKILIYVHWRTGAYFSSSTHIYIALLPYWCLDRITLPFLFIIYWSISDQGFELLHVYPLPPYLIYSCWTHIALVHLQHLSVQWNQHTFTKQSFICGYY